MKILIVGDIHSHFEMLRLVVQKTDAEMVLQCGDFGYWPTYNRYKLPRKPLCNKKGKPVPVHFCDGNHEDHKALKVLRATGNFEIAPRIFYQRRGSILTLPDGRTVLFAGGAYSIDRQQRIAGVTWFEEEVLTTTEAAGFPDCRVDIVVSHTAPASLDLGINAFNLDVSRLALDDILVRYKPAVWFFGHWHRQFKVRHKACDFFGLSLLENAPIVPKGTELAWLTNKKCNFLKLKGKGS
jgi:predicted phosphodiesterase